MSKEITLRARIGRNIKIMLAARGMKISELAERLNVTPGAVSHWVSGSNAMSVETLGMIAKVLKIEPAALLAAPEQVADNLAMLLHPIPENFWTELPVEG